MINPIHLEDLLINFFNLHCYLRDSLFIQRVFFLFFQAGLSYLLKEMATSRILDSLLNSSFNF